MVSAWDQLEGPFVMAPVPPGFKMVTVRCQWQQCQWPSKFPSRSLGSAEFGTHCHSSRPNPPKSHLCPWMSSVALGVEFQQRRPHNNNPYWIQLNQKKTIQPDDPTCIGCRPARSCTATCAISVNSRMDCPGDDASKGSAQSRHPLPSNI